MNSQSISGWLQDKSLWVALLGLVLPSLSAKLGVQLSSDKISALIVIAVTYILAHKSKSAFILWSEMKQKALAAVSDPAPAPAPVLAPAAPAAT